MLGTAMEGQIYIPVINVLLMVCAVVLVAGFKTSSNLANAYGLAVCGDILILELVFFFVVVDYNDFSHI